MNMAYFTFRRKDHFLFLELIGYLFRNTPNFPKKCNIMKLMRNQIQGKGYTTCISFDHGNRIYLNLDDYISLELFFKGIYGIESDLVELFDGIFVRGMTFLDIGAHIGYYTLQAAARVGGEGAVHAFEPIGKTFEYLKKNILLNKLTNVHVNQYIVHDCCGKKEVFVYDERNVGTSSILEIDGKEPESVEIVECITIDEYITQKRLKEVHALKIDVEGNELRVLKGMKNLLESKSLLHIIVEIHEEYLLAQNRDPIEIYKFLQKFGFLPKEVTLNKSIVLFTKKV